MTIGGIFSTLDDVVNALVDIYNAIICIPDEIICWIETGIIIVLNLFIVGFVGLVEAVANPFIDGLGALINSVYDASFLVVNALISGLADTVNAVLGILPGMPSFPNIPSEIYSGYDYVSYFFPVGFFFSFLATLVTLYLVWLGIAIILRWGKVTGGTAA